MPDLQDRLDRPLRDLRVSVTDRCNFRCPYCMPRDFFGAEFPFLPREGILTFEEIYRLAVIFQSLGMRKIRLTGGEPLLRADLPVLVELLARIPEIEIALTTNGSLLVHQAEALAEAGLSRVTVSLDSLDDVAFRAMNDVDMPVARVLEGIEAAAAAGLTPVKINAVIKKGLNDRNLAAFVERFRGTGHILRFIEYMDVGTTNGWRLDDVVTAQEILERLSAGLDLVEVPSNYRGEVARRWRFREGTGEIGVIASVTRPFCGDCTRARLSADGHLFTCLFASRGFDLRTALRDGSSDDDLRQQISEIWRARADRYSELRSAATAIQQRPEMSYLGG
jgi:cyclic pyranopterin phosphate synthase